jgi:hypothetical protein
MTTLEEVRRFALLSPDGLYRYTLDRTWNPSRGWVAWVMLNPSTADGLADDATIRRCIGFTRAWGYGALRVVNLYALRSTEPDALWSHPDPVGPDNDHHLRLTAAGAARYGFPIVAAWGAFPRADARVEQVLKLPCMDRLSVLKLTKGGRPGHPLYLKGDLVPELWKRSTA